MAARSMDPQAQDEKREAILHASLEVFARQGFGATRITDLAHKAGISPGLLYHYFKDKDAIFTELVRRALESSINSYALAQKLPGGPAYRLYSIFTFILNHAYQGPGPWYFMIMIQAMTFTQLPQASLDLVQERLGEYSGLLIPLIKEGQTTGDFVQRPPEVLAGLVSAMIQGYAVLKTQGGMESASPDAELLIAPFLTTRGTENLEKDKAAFTLS